MVEDDVSASFGDIEGMQSTFAVKIADAEAPEPCAHAEATNIEWHSPHLVAQEFRHISSVNPNSPKHFLALTDHSIYLPLIKHRKVQRSVP